MTRSLLVTGRGRLATIFLNALEFDLALVELRRQVSDITGSEKPTDLAIDSAT